MKSLDHDITKFEYLKSLQNTGTVIIGIQLNNHKDIDNLKANVDV